MDVLKTLLDQSSIEEVQTVLDQKTTADSHRVTIPERLKSYEEKTNLNNLYSMPDNYSEMLDNISVPILLYEIRRRKIRVPKRGKMSELVYKKHLIRVLHQFSLKYNCVTNSQLCSNYCKKSVKVHVENWW